MSFFEKRPLCAALASFIGVFAASSFVGFSVKLAVLLTGVLIAALLFIVKRRFNIICGIAAACSAACVLSLVFYGVIVKAQTDLIGREAKMEAVVKEVTYSSSYSSFANVKITSVGGEKVSFNAKLTAGFPLDAERDDTIVFDGKIVELSEDNDGFNEKRYYNSKSIYVAVEATGERCEHTGKAPKSVSSFFAEVNDFCASRLSKLLSGDALGLSKAVFLGDKSDLSRPFIRDFRAIGLSHLLAVSGLHLSILIGGVYTLLKLLSVGKKARTAVVAALCVFYMGLTGSPPSILRSGIMFLIILLSDLIFKYNDPVTSLFAAGAGMILFSPSTIYDAGFLLSFFATLGILVVSPRLFRSSEAAYRRGRAARLFFKFIYSPVVVTLAAVAFTLPLTAYYFGRIYILSPLTNIIFAPLITVILFLSPLLVFASYVPFIGAFFGFIVSKIGGLTVYLSSVFSKTGFGNMPLNYPFVMYLIIAMLAATAVLFFIKLKHEYFYIIPFCAFLVVYFVARGVFLSGFDSYSYAACYSDGSNDAVCLYENGETTLIDVSAGRRTFISGAADLMPDIFYRDRIDRFAVTHYHNYIVSAFERLTDDKYVGSLLLAPTVNEKEEGVCSSLIEICERKEIPYVFTDVLTDGTEFVHGYISRSTHPVIRLTIPVGGDRFLYAGSSYGEKFDQSGVDIVFIGSHGPKEKKGFSLGRCETAVFCDAEREELVTVESEEKLYIDQNGGCVVLRIKK